MSDFVRINRVFVRLSSFSAITSVFDNGVLIAEDTQNFSLIGLVPYTHGCVPYSYLCDKVYYRYQSGYNVGGIELSNPDILSGLTSALMESRCEYSPALNGLNAVLRIAIDRSARKVYAS